MNQRSGDPIRGVIFDLDGTLVDSGGEIAAALNAAFLELGLPSIPKERVESFVGRGVRVLVERALAHLGATCDVDDALARFESRYADNIGTGARLFAGVLPGLERLHAARLPMGVVTNKPRFFTQRLLERLAIDRFFAATVAGDDGIARKPRGDMLVEACRRMGVEPSHSLMLGDSDNDVAAARAARCRIWCVPYGYNEGRPPESLACDRLVDSVDAAARLILGEAPPARA